MPALLADSFVLRCPSSPPTTLISFSAERACLRSLRRSRKPWRILRQCFRKRRSWRDIHLKMRIRNNLPNYENGELHQYHHRRHISLFRVPRTDRDMTRLVRQTTINRRWAKTVHRFLQRRLSELRITMVLSLSNQEVSSFCRGNPGRENRDTT